MPTFIFSLCSLMREKLKLHEVFVNICANLMNHIDVVVLGIRSYKEKKRKGRDG